MHSRAKQWAAVAALIVLLGSMTPTRADPLPPLRRVNAPYFPSPGQIIFSQTSIFWFGKVTLDENYVDGRIGYDDQRLFGYFIVFDRRLWYLDGVHTPEPAPGNLTSMDSVTLYLNQAGNTGSTLSQAYRFDSQMTQWEPRASWQAAYQGSGTNWSLTLASPYTTMIDVSWSSGTVGGFNNNQDNRGWAMSFDIPWTSLGRSGPPPQGTVWGLAVAVHDRDTAPPGAMQPDKTWPETGVSGTNPSTWGQLYFGQPPYMPPSATVGGTTTIRQGLNSAVVVDGAVGGGPDCGGSLPNDPNDPTTLFTQWGELNYSDAMTFLVRNQIKTADWPCFSKYYVTFPLTSLRVGKVIISATLTLHQMGHTDGPGGKATSYLQVLTVDGPDWSESSLDWNSAPMARESVAGTSVPPLTDDELLHNDPGPARTWNVSRAVAEAFAAGEPLRLAVYSADEPMQSGKYFWASEHPDTWSEARPSLSVQWGDPVASVQKTVQPATLLSGQLMTYTLSFIGSGNALTLTDNLPAQVSAPVSGIGVDGAEEPATYSPGPPRIISWTGTPSVGVSVTLTFAVTAVVPGPVAVYNTAVLTEASGHVSTDTVFSIVDPRLVQLPLILRR